MIDASGSALTLKGRPFVKWAGGKTALLPTLRRFIPSWYGKYFEPFVGGGAFFFDLEPDTAVLSDSNEELIRCYKIVRDKPAALLRALSALEVSETDFYDIRGTDPAHLPSVDRAARFIYLNKTCFNGLYRVNRAGQFNTPFGHYKRATLAEDSKLKAASRALKTAKLVCGDYADLLLNDAVAGDFVYFDPPYHPVSEYSDFKRYTKTQFRHADHVRLAEAIPAESARGKKKGGE
jgi:DNA adenine methylase